MGRRTASRNEEALVPQGTNTSSERVEPQAEGPGLEMMGKTNSKLTIEEQATKTSRKRPKYYNALVRRSLCIQDRIMPADDLNMEHLIEDITVRESEDEQPTHKMHRSTSGEKSMEEKVDYLVQLLETMNSRGRNKNSDFCESPSLVYRSLYADSQRIEALTNENHQLSLKLEVALAKLEAYENGTHAFAEMADKLKDAILVSNLAKATETVVNLSSQTACEALAPRDELLSHFVNLKWPIDHAPKAAAKRNKQDGKANGKYC